jgi:hypothetical protein
MAKPPKLGSVNAYKTSAFIWKGQKGTFNGTTTDLAKKVAEMGAKRGDLLQAIYGSMNYNWCLEESPMIFCDRGNGEDWCSKFLGSKI